MRLGRKENNLQGSSGEVEPVTGASRIKLQSSKSHRAVPPTYESAPGASHDPSLYHQVQDEDGTVKTYFETHPGGNRKQRRYRLGRHRPEFTKKPTGGRDWQIVARDRQKGLEI